jgi:catechol 2,3-dioxygenase-like lactoylglutathione lyase family enzyme
VQLGEQSLELIQFLSPPDVRLIPVPSYSNDLWFQHVAIVVRDMDAAWMRLRRHHVRQISPRPQTIPISNPAAAGIKAIKFRDPDGHNLELLWFPEGKGNPIWKKPGANLLLGIDHTAMTVRSTESSIKFYRDLLGMTVAGGSLNVGIEQEHLDSFPGARARVTGLALQRGQPGIEFLEYELPTAGRPLPMDSRPTDLWHCQTTLVVSDVEAAAALLPGIGRAVSSGTMRNSWRAIRRMSSCVRSSRARSPRLAATSWASWSGRSPPRWAFAMPSQVFSSPMTASGRSRSGRATATWSRPSTAWRGRPART